MGPHDIQNKLSSIITAYSKALPDKVAAIEQLYQDIKKQWDPKKFADLYRRIHNIHGSAGMYGYADLGQVAEQLELYLKTFFHQQPTAEQLDHIEQFLSLLSAYSHNAPVSIQKPIAPGVQLYTQSKVLYILGKNNALIQNIVLQLSSFGYSSQVFHNIKALAKACNQFPVVAIIMDVEFLNTQLEGILQKIRKQAPFIPLFFIAKNDEFYIHLRAVRAGAQSYFTMPVQVEEIVAKLDQLREQKEPRNILIVEDDEDTSHFYATIFRQAGMQIKIVPKPAQIDKALAEFKPDLILMDIYMPGCSGIELATIIRQRNVYASIPIVFLSSEQDTQTQLEAMSLGGDDFITKSIDPEHLIHIVKNKIARYDELRSYMVKDGLTGALNHSAVQQKLELDLKLASRLKIPLAVAMIDLDHFKKTNDTYGHRIGDQVLKNLCVLMQTRLRKTDTIGRYGGEEFLVILPNTPAEPAKYVLDQMREQFSKVAFFNNNDEESFHQTFSAGIAISPPYMTAASIIEAADQAMYTAKKEGRNHITLAK